MDTPLVSMSLDELDCVYEPSEDSYLLMDALEADLDTLRAAKPLMCLEIGSGSGVIITALAMALSKHRKCYCAAVDINPHACAVTKKTSLANSVDVEVVQMDLLTCVHSRRVFDLIVFNPPYVVTESDEVIEDRLIFKTWAGGRNGRQVMERVFGKIPEILSDQGVFYLVVIKENDPKYILQTFRKLEMLGEIVAERKVRGEHLYILRFRKINSAQLC